jgi:hypothetical protein
MDGANATLIRRVARGGQNGFTSFGKPAGNAIGAAIGHGSNYEP